LSDHVPDPPLLLPAPAETATREPPPASKVCRRSSRGERPLSWRQRRFVAEYLVDCNATAAALRAGYSERASHQGAGKLMEQPKIKEAIRQAMDARLQRVQISADRILLELTRIAFSDIGRIIDWSEDGLVVEGPGRLSLDDRAAISEITVIPGDGQRKFAVKVKLHDKYKALRLLAHHVRLIGPHAIESVESPSVAAERIRKLILERHAKLVAERDG
jgi:phage terminase small subunit